MQSGDAGEPPHHCEGSLGGSLLNDFESRDPVDEFGSAVVLNVFTFRDWRH